MILPHGPEWTTTEYLQLFRIEIMFNSKMTAARSTPTTAVPRSEAAAEHKGLNAEAPQPSLRRRSSTGQAFPWRHSKIQHGSRDAPPDEPSCRSTYASCIRR